VKERATIRDVPQDAELQLKAQFAIWHSTKLLPSKSEVWARSTLTKFQIRRASHVA
jgi:hypothetical protein